MAIEIRLIRIADLVGFYEEFDRSPRGTRPINRARAVSQAENPQARADDVALLVAFDGGRCLGYLGILPTRLRLGARFVQVQAFSTWFVESQSRHTGAGALLMVRALSLGNHMLACGMGPDSIRALAPLNMLPVGPLVHGRLTLDRSIEKVTAPLRVLRRVWRLTTGRKNDLHPAIKLIRSTLRSLKAARWTALESALPRPDADWVPVSSVPAMTTDAETPETAFHRGAVVVNWMLRRPAGAPVAAVGGDRDYHFNGDHDLIEPGAAELRPRGGGQTRGWAHWLCTQAFGRTKLRLLDYAFADPADAGALPALLAQIGRAADADELEFPVEVTNVMMRIPVLARCLEIQRVPYLFRISGRAPGEIGAAGLSRLTLRMADGDMWIP